MMRQKLRVGYTDEIFNCVDALKNICIVCDEILEKNRVEQAILKVYEVNYGVKVDDR